VIQRDSAVTISQFEMFGGGMNSPSVQVVPLEFCVCNVAALFGSSAAAQGNYSGVCGNIF
jgi:hypothetical protein